MLTLLKFRALNVTDKFLFSLTSILLLILTTLLLLRKVEYFFVDDWAIFNDFSTSRHGLNLTNLAPYNGHSLIVTRILFIFITATIGIQISTFSIILTISLLGTVFFLARSASRGFMTCNKNFAFFTIVIVCLNLNQYQNLTMPICWSWTICLIAIIWTYLLTNQDLNIYRGTLLLILSVIGPLTLSFGFIIPGFLILKLAHEIYLGKRRRGNFILLTCITFFTLFVFKIAILNSTSEYGSFTNPSIIFKRPINSIIFLLTSIGSPFTPASRFSVMIASVFGLVIFLLLFKIVQNAKSLSNFFVKDGFISLGIIFHMIHLLGRYDGSWTSILISSQPRYSTGAILLVLGIFLNLIRSATRNIQLVLVILLATMTLSGAKTAGDFSTERHKESVQISNCISNHTLTSSQCEQFLFPGERILTQAKFRKAIIYLESVSAY